MAALYVRDMIRLWATTSTLPFYDTVNQQQAPTDPIWWTVRYSNTEQNKVTFCGDRLESGVISLMYFGQTGIGDQALFTAVEAEVPLFYANVDPLDKLVLVDYSELIDFADGDHRGWYMVQVDMDYHYQP